jgi:glutamate racemase
MQLSFMRAFESGERCPPPKNIRLFTQLACSSIDLYRPDVMMITCSTMNRTLGAIRKATARSRVPVVQIDEPMMEATVARGGRALVIATHGPTVASTQALLAETAARTRREISLEGATIDTAFKFLGVGAIARHNALIARAIRGAQRRQRIDTVVLAQLSMAVFLLEHTSAEEEFGVPVLSSAECGFRHVRELLLAG